MADSGGRTTDTMSGADALLWTIGQDPIMRPTILAVMMLDRAPRWHEVQARLRSLTEKVPRLRSRAVTRPFGRGRPQFVVDHHFNLDLHLTRVLLPAPGTARDVLDMAQHMATIGFDHHLPLWQAVVVEQVDGDHAAVIFKLHHSLIDGVGGLSVLMDLLDTEADGPARPAPRAVAPVDAAPRSRRGMLPNPLGIARGAFGVATHPAQPVSRLGSTAASVARLLAPAGKPLSALMAGRSSRRSVEAFDIELDRLRQVAKKSGVTVNDVFVASVMQGLSRYHDMHGSAPAGLRALMPVSVRADGDGAAGNHFVPARFVIPLRTEAAACLDEVQRITSVWKHAPGLALSDVLATLLSTLPAAVATAMWGSMLKGDDFCVTNVPGLPFETFLAGARIDRLYAFAPPSGAALNVSLVSCHDRAGVGITIDTAAIPDSAKLAACIEDGFADVCRLARPARRKSR